MQANNIDTEQLRIITAEYRDAKVENAHEVVNLKVGKDTELKETALINARNNLTESIRIQNERLVNMTFEDRVLDNVIRDQMN